jgi:hypothetical protein
MENTLTQAKTFKQLRTIVQVLQKSVEQGYLRKGYKAECKDTNYEDIVETGSQSIKIDGQYYYLYAICEDCVMVDDEWFHAINDADEYHFDELDECCISSGDSVLVNDRRREFYTHIDNCNSSNEIYQLGDDFYTMAYIDNDDDLVFDIDGDLRHRDDVYYWESDDEYHDEAEDEDYDEDEEQNENSSIIRNYSFKPILQFISMPYDSKEVPFFGIELEVERMDKSETSRGDMAKKIENKAWYFKNDGSLNNGFELVSHPLTFSYIKHSAKDFESALNELSNNAYNSYNANTCGMHIHISKKAFGTWQLYKFMKFFAENVPFIVAISQRKMEKLVQWANIEDNDDNALMYKAKKKEGNSARYVAINLQNYSTIEVRIFRGTLNFNSFMKNIEFIHALYMFTKESKIITLDSFKEYIANSCEYSNLKKFIKLKNL